MSQKTNPTSLRLQKRFQNFSFAFFSDYHWNENFVSCFEKQNYTAAFLKESSFSETSFSARLFYKKFSVWLFVQDSRISRKAKLFSFKISKNDKIDKLSSSSPKIIFPNREKSTLEREENVYYKRNTTKELLTASRKKGNRVIDCLFSAKTVLRAENIGFASHHGQNRKNKRNDLIPLDAKIKKSDYVISTSFQDSRKRIIKQRNIALPVLSITAKIFYGGSLSFCEKRAVYFYHSQKQLSRNSLDYNSFAFFDKKNSYNQLFFQSCAQDLVTQGFNNVPLVLLLKSVIKKEKSAFALSLQSKHKSGTATNLRFVLQSLLETNHSISWLSSLWSPSASRDTKGINFGAAHTFGDTSCPPKVWHVTCITSRAITTAFQPIRNIQLFQDIQSLLDIIVFLIERRIGFRQIKSILFKELSKDCASVHPELKGLKIIYSGRLGGRSKKAQKAKTQQESFGSTTAASFSSKIVFGSKSAMTAYGKIGVKIWLSFV